MANGISNIEKDILRILTEFKLLYRDGMTINFIISKTRLTNCTSDMWPKALKKLEIDGKIERNGVDTFDINNPHHNRTGFRLVPLEKIEKHRERGVYLEEIKKYVGITEWFFNTTPLTK